MGRDEIMKMRVTFFYLLEYQTPRTQSVSLNPGSPSETGKVCPTVQGPRGQISLSRNYLCVRDHRNTDVESRCSMAGNKEELRCTG